VLIGDPLQERSRG